MLTMRAVEMESNYRNGILPHVGGWLDQDEQDVQLILLASSARSDRERILHTKAARDAKSRSKRRR